MNDGVPQQRNVNPQTTNEIKTSTELSQEDRIAEAIRGKWRGGENTWKWG